MLRVTSQAVFVQGTLDGKVSLGELWKWERNAIFYVPAGYFMDEYIESIWHPDCSYGSVRRSRRDEKVFGEIAKVATNHDAVRRFVRDCGFKGVGVEPGDGSPLYGFGAFLFDLTSVCIKLILEHSRHGHGSIFDDNFPVLSDLEKEAQTELSK